ncbi:MAG: exodeoxyribonuclease VII small subunit [Methanomicrobiales archaeon]|nr:exodeoxyribonuclease VII small subunit [Methanomicrobiales archaeon]
MTRKFEDLMTELREIVRQIEDSETSLDRSLELYERGAVLVKECERLLAEAELKITDVTKGQC